MLQVCKCRQHESAGLQHATNMNQEFKNSTCSESTRARYENEIPLCHHLVKENEYMKDHIEINHTVILLR